MVWPTSAATAQVRTIGSSESRPEMDGPFLNGALTHLRKMPIVLLVTSTAMVGLTLPVTRLPSALGELAFRQATAGTLPIGRAATGFRISTLVDALTETLLELARLVSSAISALVTGASRFTRQP